MCVFVHTHARPPCRHGDREGGMLWAKAEDNKLAMFLYNLNGQSAMDVLLIIKGRCYCILLKRVYSKCKFFNTNIYVIIPFLNLRCGKLHDIWKHKYIYGVTNDSTQPPINFAASVDPFFCLDKIFKLQAMTIMNVS